MKNQGIEYLNVNNIICITPSINHFWLQTKSECFLLEAPNNKDFNAYVNLAFEEIERVKKFEQIRKRMTDIMRALTGEDINGL